jgi:hypothetical protein
LDLILTNALYNHTVGYKFPEVFHLEILHSILFFNAVQLAMTAVAGDYQHPGAGSPDLVHLSPAIKNAFRVVSINQRAASSAAADLVHFRGVKIGPVFDALAEDPARFFEKSVSKPFLGFSAVVTWIVIGCRAFEPCFIQFDASFLDVPYEKIEYRDEFEFFKYFGIMFFETRPGRQISVPSLGPHQCFDLQFLHVFDNPAGHDLHGLVITGKIAPVGSLPVFRRHCPVLFGRMKNPPPVL